MGALEPGDGEATEADLAAQADEADETQAEEPSETGERLAQTDEDDNAIDNEFDDDEDDDEDEDEDEHDEGFGAERELCQDETCVGIINMEGVCGDCGKVASVATKQGLPRSKRESSGQAGPVDFMHRSLCPDGACVGVVGPDGRCKECGLVGESVLTDPRLRGLKTPAIADSDEETEAIASDEEAVAEESAKDPILTGEGGIEVTASAKEFANRQLCPDGSCIGVIGPAGTCKECGIAA